jgi:hypothetical protein
MLCPGPPGVSCTESAEEPHNGRFAAHLMPGVRAALAPGKRLEDVVREGMASSPVYH